MTFSVVNPSLKVLDERWPDNLVLHVSRVVLLMAHRYLELLVYESLQGPVLLTLYGHRKGCTVLHDTCAYVVRIKIRICLIFFFVLLKEYPYFVIHSVSLKFKRTSYRDRTLHFPTHLIISYESDIIYIHTV